MKLVSKLTLAFICATSLIFAINGYFRVEREVAIFEHDRVRNLELIASVLGTAVSEGARLHGSSGELNILASARHRGLDVRLLPPPNGAKTAAPATDDGTHRVLSPGEVRTRTALAENGKRRRYTSIGVELPGAPGSVLEISEPLDAEASYERRTIYDSVLTAATFDALCAAIAVLLGVWIVGRPVTALTEKARRVGRGDFSAPLELRQRDELAELAREMNAMCERLVEANQRAKDETQRRIQVIEQLRHADRLMTVGKLASGIAHELATPLNVVETRASLIADGETSANESREYAAAIAAASERMTNIIRQLMTFARPHTPNLLRCDMVEIARGTLDLLKPLAAKKEVAIHLSANDPLEAEVDGTQIGQVITNLVINAIQATDRGGKVLVSLSRTRIDAAPEPRRPDGEYVRVQVEDDGHGIPPEDLPHVFEPFFTTKDVGSGTGLGLSTAYGIVREHGGWIDAASTQGCGSTFTVHLPKTGPS